MKRTSLVVLGVLAVLVAGLALIASRPGAAWRLGRAAREAAETAGVVEPSGASSRSVAPTAPPRSTTTPAPGSYPALRAAVDEALGSSNRDMNNGRKTTTVQWRDGEPVRVVWAIDDSFTPRETALLDVFAILQAVDASGTDYERVELSGTFTLKDRYGNTAEREVLAATFGRADVERINWEGLNPLDVLGVAQTYTVHPEIAE